MLIQKQYNQLVLLQINLDRDGNKTMFFVIKQAKEIILDFSQGTGKVLWIYFTLI